MRSRADILYMFRCEWGHIEAGITPEVTGMLIPVQHMHRSSQMWKYRSSGTITHKDS